MPAVRYFTPSLTDTSQQIIVSGDEYHHIVRVMRMREGERAEFINGNGLLVTAKLGVVGKHEATFSVEEMMTETPPTRQFVLVYAMPKLQRLEFIAEKGTELGMTALWVFPGDQSEKEGLSANQNERINAILIASMKQCGRLFLPRLELKPKLSTWKEFPHRAFFGDVRKEAPRFSDVLGQDNKDSIYFFVGPESGFSAKEESILRNAGVEGVHLHDNILRTDTAGLVALVLGSGRTFR